MNFSFVTLRKIFVLSALISMISGTAKAVIIDFEGLAVNDPTQHAHGMSYTEQGFNFSSSSTAHDFATWGTLASNFFGSTALWNDDLTGVNGVTTLTKVGGGAFDLISIDIAELIFGPSSAASVTFNAIFDGGGSTSQSITLDGFRAPGNLNSFETLTFSGFNNVISVSWLQETPFHQFDNVVIRSASPIPEPATLPLLALSLVGFVLARRRCL